MYKIKLAMIVTAVAVLMLLGVFVSVVVGLGELPYAYFQFMNWIVTIAACLLVNVAFDRKMLFPVLIFGLIAVVFNPLSPMYFSAFVWYIVDIIAAIFFIIAMLLPKKSR